MANNKSYIRQCIFQNINLKFDSREYMASNNTAYFSYTNDDLLEMEGLLITPIGEGVLIEELPFWLRWIVRMFAKKKVRPNYDL